MNTMNKINERYWFRGKVKQRNPMTNPENGWVQGFYFQDLCGGEIKHFIRSGEMIWEIDPATLGMFTGYYDKGKEPKPVFEGDILCVQSKDKKDWCMLVGWDIAHGSFAVMDEVDYNARMEGEEDTYCGELAALLKMESLQIEVGGNIHENADLMTQGQPL